jgi:hypothetical protein
MPKTEVRIVDAALICWELTKKIVEIYPAEKKIDDDIFNVSYEEIQDNSIIKLEIQRVFEEFDYSEFMSRKIIIDIDYIMTCEEDKLFFVEGSNFAFNQKKGAEYKTLSGELNDDLSRYTIGFLKNPPMHISIFSIKLKDERLIYVLRDEHSEGEIKKYIHDVKEPQSPAV